jgi:beta-lactamase regulating signal transducer with metallopeptidase domain
MTMQVVAMADFDGIIPLAQAAASAWIASAWQGLAIASALGICLRIFPRASAAQRFAVWAAGFVVIVVLPFFPSLGAAPGATSLTFSGTPVMPFHLLRLDVRWSLLLSALWVTVSVIRAAMLATQSIRLRRLWKEALPVDKETLAQGHFASCNEFGGPNLFGRPIDLCTTARLDRPSVIGFFSPRILIPEWLLSRLTAADLEQIVLHESQHICRFDDWTNLLQKLLLIVFPLNPALLWIDRRLGMTREMACDEGVVQITQAPRVYATFLAGLAQHGLNHKFDLAAQGALALGAWRRRSELAHRVHSILRARPTLGPLASGGLLVTVTCGLLILAFELAQCPQLVAFVPAGSATLTANQAPIGLHESIGAQPLTAHSLMLPGYYAQDAKAMMPLDKAETMHAGAMQTHAAMTSHAPKRPASFIEAAPCAVGGDAIASGAQKAAALEKENSPAAGYIVYTSFEQVTTLPLDRGDDAEQQGDVANRDRAGRLPRATRTGATTRITITRLILRVAPADSNSAQPSAAVVDHGWFGNQL